MTSLLTPIKPEAQEPVSLLVRVNEVNETVVEAVETKSLFPNVEKKADAGETPNTALLIDLPKVVIPTEVAETATESTASEVVPTGAPAKAEGTSAMTVGIIVLLLVVVGVVAFIFIRKRSSAKTVVGAASNKSEHQVDPIVEFIKKEGGIDPLPVETASEEASPPVEKTPITVSKPKKPGSVAVAGVAKPVPSNRSTLNSRPPAPKKPGARTATTVAPNAPSGFKAPSKPKKRF